MPQILKDDIRKRIIDSAIEVFNNDMYPKASMKKIAENADISVGNIYRYYKSKEDLYNEIVKDLAEAAIEIISRLENGSSINEIFENFQKRINEFVVFSIENRSVINILLINKGNGLYDVEKHLTEVLTKNLHGISKKICNKSYLTQKDIEVLCFTNASAISAGVNTLMKIGGDEETIKRRLRTFLEQMKIGFVENMKSSKEEK